KTGGSRMYAHPEIHRELVRQHQADLDRRRGHRSQPTQADGSVEALVRAAKAGDHDAWATLIEQFTPMLRNIVWGYRLSAADVDDVVQETWVAAYTHVDRLHEPEAFGGWLAVTARRNALRVLERSRRELVADEEQFASSATDATPESALLESEERRA